MSGEVTLAGYTGSCTLSENQLSQNLSEKFKNEKAFKFKFINNQKFTAKGVSIQGVFRDERFRSQLLGQFRKVKKRDNFDKVTEESVTSFAIQKRQLATLKFKDNHDKTQTIEVEICGGVVQDR